MPIRGVKRRKCPYKPAPGKPALHVIVLHHVRDVIPIKKLESQCRQVNRKRDGKQRTRSCFPPAGSLGNLPKYGFINIFKVKMLQGLFPNKVFRAKDKENGPFCEGSVLFWYSTGEKRAV